MSQAQLQPPQLPPLVCSRCGSMNPPYATQCWLCSGASSAGSTSGSSAGLSGTVAGLVPADQYVADPAIARWHARTQTICAALLVVCVVLTVLIAIGIAVDQPGALIAFGIVVGPAYLATGLRALRSMTTHEKMDASKLLITFILSGTFTVLAIFFLVIASFVAFFVWCLYEVANGRV